MLSERNANHYAQSSKIALDVAERDVILTFVLKILSEEATKQPLIDRLAFKGGTCLRKIYFGKATRFSMDLDFTADGVELVDLRKRVRKLIDQREHYAIRFAIRDEFSRSGRDDSSYGAIIDYVHEWNSSSFELNVSLRERPCLKVQRLGLKEELYFKYCNFKPFEIPCIEVVSRYGEGSLCNFSVNVHLKHMQSHEPVNGTGLEIPSMD